MPVRMGRSLFYEPGENVNPEADVSGALAEVKGGQMDLSYKKLRNLKLMRDLMQPTEQQKQERTENLGIIKDTIQRFQELITNQNTSPGARDIMRRQMILYAGMIPEKHRAQLGPILAFSPVDPVQQALDKFDQFNPEPGYAIGGRTKEEAEGSEYGKMELLKYQINHHDWNVKRQMFKNKQSGIKEDAQVYQQTFFPVPGENDKYAYRSPISGEFGIFDMKKVPQDMLKNAVEELKVPMTQILKTGKIPLDKGKDFQVKDTHYNVEKTYDVLTGKTEITHRQLTPDQPGKSVKMSDTLMKGLSAVNMAMSPDDVTDPREKEIVKVLGGLDIEGILKGTNPNDKKRLSVFNEQMRTEHGYIVVPRSDPYIRGWLRYLPLVNNYYSEQTWQAVEVDKNMVSYTDKTGKTGTFYYSPGAKLAVDSEGLPVEASKNIPPGGQLPIEFKKPPAVIPKPEKIPTENEGRIEDTRRVMRLINSPRYSSQEDKEWLKKRKEELVKKLVGNMGPEKARLYVKNMTEEFRTDPFEFGRDFQEAYRQIVSWLNDLEARAVQREQEAERKARGEK